MPRDNRQIFPYYNGSADIFGDPVVIDRRFLKAAADAEIDIDGLAAHIDGPIEEARQDAYGRLLPLIDAAFAVKPLAEDGTGLAENERLALLDAFSAWKSHLKLVTGQSPSSSAPTDGASTASAPPSPAASDPTAS